MVLDETKKGQRILRRGAVICASVCNSRFIRDQLRSYPIGQRAVAPSTFAYPALTTFQKKKTTQTSPKALLASAAEPISTVPQPREVPLAFFVTSAFTTVPAVEKQAFKSSSVTPQVSYQKVKRENGFRGYISDVEMAVGEINNLDLGRSALLLLSSCSLSFAFGLARLTSASRGLSFSFRVLFCGC